MLSKHYILGIGSFVVGAISLCLFLCSLRPSNIIAYKEMMQQNKETLSLRTLERYPTYQIRKHTQKEIWKTNRSKTPWMQLKSASSKLTLKQKKNQLDMIEELSDISCFLQTQETPIQCFAISGNYYYPSHQLILHQVECISSSYYLKADHATKTQDQITFSDHVHISHPLGQLNTEKATIYDISNKHKSHEIILENKVHASIERLYRNNLKNRNFGKKAPQNSHSERMTIALGQGMSENSNFEVKPTPPKTDSSSCFGINENISIASENAKCIVSPTFSLLPSEEIQFSKNVNIQIDSKEKFPITATGDLAIYKTNSFTLYPKFPKSHCHLYLQAKSPIHLETQKIQFRFIQKELICLQPRGFITINDKPGFLVADEMHFNTENQSLSFSSTSSQKVLFWQDGFSLSAHEIQIEKNPITKKETIQGIGDTRFQLTQEETTIINSIISKYL